jgi:hypothetical protein
MAWLKKQNREIALGAVRSRMRASGLYPERQSGKTALTFIDEIAREAPETRAAKWYVSATDNEICLFIRDWKKWRSAEIKEQLRNRLQRNEC